MAKWTTKDIPDQRGRIAVVTGANSGLGFVTSRELAKAGAHTVLACRNPARGEEAARRIRDEAPEAEVEVLRLDLADLASVRAFADEAGRRYAFLDLLVNNAGVMAMPHRLTIDGFEMHFGTNHLGHFALTGLLTKLLLAHSHPRVVTVSSGLHERGRIDFDDLQGEHQYSRWGAYEQSKLANLLFAYELQRRADAAGFPLRSIGVHPGYAATNLQTAGADMDENLLMAGAMKLGNAMFAQSDEMGALPILYAATEPDLPDDRYLYVGPGGLYGMRGHPKTGRSSSASRDPDVAKRLWEVSEELTGVRYPF